MVEEHQAEREAEGKKVQEADQRTGFAAIAGAVEPD